MFFVIKSYGQEKKLQETWILDKVFYENGKDIEINNPLFSTNLIYKISPKNIKINKNNFNANFIDNTIQTLYRKINYKFLNDYLLLQDENDKKIYAFLKREDFIKRYPEFEAKIEFKNRDSLLISNEITQPDFQSDITFDDFLIKNMYQGSSKDDEDLYFKAEYILTKKNKIKDIIIKDGHNPRYDKEFAEALLKGEKYFQNPYGKDLLITKETNFLKWMSDLKSDDERKLYEIIEKGEGFYNSNKFEKAISEFEMIKNLKIGENRFNTIIEDANLKLAISYLATNQIENACKSFSSIGDKTKFKVRNYLINFCNKNLEKK